jgi:hypothetical protein
VSRFFEEQGILKAEQGDSLADYGVLKAGQDNSRPHPTRCKSFGILLWFGVKRPDSCLDRDLAPREPHLLSCRSYSKSPLWPSFFLGKYDVFSSDSPTHPGS